MTPLAVAPGGSVLAVVFPLVVGVFVPLLRLLLIVAVVALLAYLLYRLVT